MFNFSNCRTARYIKEMECNFFKFYYSVYDRFAPSIEVLTPLSLKILAIIFYSVIFCFLTLLPCTISLFGMLVPLTLDLVEFIAIQFKKDSVSIPLTNIYPLSGVAEMLCTIMIENANALDIVTPNSYNDILPVQHPVLRDENGFPCYDFIVQHSSNPEIDTKTVSELLNLKICQYLQAYCNRYPIVYNGLPVVKVLRVKECIYHPQCYAIRIMVVDSDAKVNYILSLERKSTSNKPCADEDF